jgi:hypothetical protein
MPALALFARTPLLGSSIAILEEFFAYILPFYIYSISYTVWEFVQQESSVRSVCPLCMGLLQTDFPGFFHGDASGAIAAPCICIVELYTCPHLIYLNNQIHIKI